MAQGCGHLSAIEVRGDSDTSDAVVRSRGDVHEAASTEVATVSLVLENERRCWLMNVQPAGAVGQKGGKNT